MADSELIFRKGAFIAIRHDSGWWLAQLYTHVHEDTSKARIRWFDLISDSDKKIYVTHECNDVPAKSIICTVRTERVSSKPTKVSVNKEECREIEKCLMDSKNPKAVIDQTNTTPKKRAKQSKNKPQKVKQNDNVRKGAPIAKTGKRKAATPTLPMPKKKQKVSPYSNATIYHSNPIYDMRVTIPSIAPSVNSLWLNRAVFNKEYKAVEKLAGDLDSFSSMCYSYDDDCDESPDIIKSPWNHAVDSRDKKMTKLLKDLVTKNSKLKKKRVSDTSNLFTMVTTGIYNPSSLGILYIRPLTMARGSREGSNAFNPLSSCTEQMPSEDIYSYAIQTGCDYEFLKYLVLTKEAKSSDMDLIFQFPAAVKYGNCDVAAKIANESVSCGDKDNFNQLHYEVLAFDKNEPLSPFKSVNCHKKTGQHLGKITPLHSVCLNPNTKYLKQMLVENPQIDIKDGEGNIPLHYAAVSKSDAATKYLLGANVAPLALNNNGETPLMWAARAGSVTNIKALVGHAYAEHYQDVPPSALDPKRMVDIVLIKEVMKAASGSKTKQNKAGEDDNESVSDNIAMMKLKKQGVGGMEISVTKGPLQSYTALTLAVEYGHPDVVSVLCDLGADPNKPTGAGKRRMSPLIIAAKRGHLDIIKTLLLHNANARVRDRHGLTAFHYAAKYNQLHCLSWLAANCLSDANAGDSSGNTALQYACAEGFILVVKYLVEELRADVTVLNSWGMSALEISLLRQQTGIIEYLLNQSGVDINFRDNRGATMIMRLCGADLDYSMDLIKYLVNKKGADVHAVDNDGCNALHYLAVQKRNYDKDSKIVESCLDLLIKTKGIDVNGKTNAGKSALVLACKSEIAKVISAIIRRRGDIASVKMDKDRNILQHFASLAHEEHTVDVLNSIQSNASKKVLADLKAHVDEDGMNALLIATQKFAEFRPPRQQWGSKSDSEDPKDYILQVIKKLLSSPFSYDVNTEVKERKLKDSDKCSCSEESKGHAVSCPRYPYTQYGKFRLLDFMMKYGSTENIRLVLGYRPDLNNIGTDGMYPLHRAIVGGKTELVLLLIEHGAAIDLLPKTGFSTKNRHENCPAIVLAANYCIDAVMPLVDAGACIKSSDTDGMNVLHHIVSNFTDLPKRITIAEWLFPSIDNADTIDNEGNSYLHHAVQGVECGSNVSIEMISLLLLMGADPNLINLKGQTPLHYGLLSKTDPTSFSDPIEVISILTHVMDKTKIGASDFYHGFTPLHLSAMRGGSVTSLHLISHGCQIDQLDNQGNTPLTLSVAGRHQSSVLMLLQHGASIDRCIQYPLFRREPEPARAKPGATNEIELYEWLPLKEKPLSVPPVISHSNLILYKVIGYEWQGVLFTLVDMMRQSFVPLEAAIRLCKFNLAITLMLKFGKSLKPSDSNDQGQTLLHILCLTNAKNLELQQRVLNLLLKFDYSLSAKDVAYKCTPLHYACLQQKFELAKSLIKPNTINSKDSFGRTPVCSLFWNNSTPNNEFLRYLVKEGASLEMTCDFNVHESDYPLFDYVIKTSRSDYFASFNNRFTLLGKSVIDNNKEIVKLLLELGADVNTADSKGMTALMYAAKLNNIEMFELLISLSSKYNYKFMRQSNEGRTVLHYIVLAHPLVQLAKPVIINKMMSLLKGSGDLIVVLDIKDNNNKSVNDYCVEYNYQSYIDIFNRAQNIHVPRYVAMEISENDCAPDIPDFDTDCVTFFDSYTADIDKDLSTSALPDECLSLAREECEVCKDPSGKYFDVLMTKIDIKVRAHGIYNFYKMQLVKNIGKNIFILLTRWGRIGDHGQHQETPFPTFEECKAEFQKVFKSKTRNDWSNFDNFVIQPGKYRLVSREMRYHNKFKSVKYDFKPVDRPDGVNKQVFDVLLEACDPVQMTKLLEDDFKLNVSQLPYGFIKKEDICEAEAILENINKLVQESNKLRTTIEKPQSQAAFKLKTQEIYDLTNELYHLIPQNGYHITKIHPINTDCEISIWKSKLQNMKDLEVVNRIMAASQLDLTAKHPIQYIYESLGCTIEVLDRYSIVAQYIRRNIYSALSSVSIIGMYKLHRYSEHKPSKIKGEKQLFYHGLSCGTLLSILKRGLQNAPYGRTYGDIFGNGIYVTDNFSKSLSYARGSKSRFVLAVSVTKGKIYKFQNKSWEHNRKPPKGVNTIVVPGRQVQKPAHDIVLPNGEMLPMASFETIKPSKEAPPIKNAKKSKPGLGFGVWGAATAQNNGTTHSDDDSASGSDADSNNSEDSEDLEIDSEDGSNAGPTSTSIQCMTEHSEFVIMNADAITLEYLIQVK